MAAALAADPPGVDLWRPLVYDAFGSTLGGVGTVGPQLDQDRAASFYAAWGLTA
jgi:hypothetical protein